MKTEMEWRSAMVEKLACLATSQEHLAKTLEKSMEQNEERWIGLNAATNDNKLSIDRLTQSQNSLLACLEKYVGKSQNEMNNLEKNYKLDINRIDKILHGDGEVDSKDIGLIGLYKELTGIIRSLTAKWVTIITLITFVGTLATEHAVKVIFKMWFK